MREIAVTQLPFGALVRPDYVDNFVLAAGVSESFTVPSGAKFVIIAATDEVWTNYVALTATEALDLVTNGAFASDTGWTKGTGWTIAAGVASSDGSQAGNADLSQTPTLTKAVQSGKAYRCVFTVSGYSAGNVRVVLGAGTAGTNRAADGTFTETIIAGSDGTIILRADLDFVGNIDNFSVTPVALEPTTEVSGGVGCELNVAGFRDISDVQRIDLVSPATCKGSLAYYKWTRP